MERAEKSRAPIQGIADRLAGYLVYFALGAAVLTFLITHNVRSAISVAIVAGACGIAAGTLTYGTPEVVDVRHVECLPVAFLLQPAVTAESRSEHPVAKAILKKGVKHGNLQ